MDLHEIFKEEIAKGEEVFYVIKNASEGGEIGPESPPFHMRINRFKPPYTDVSLHIAQLEKAVYIGRGPKYHTFVVK